MSHLLTGGDELAVTEPVFMEVLAGARDDRRERDLRRLLQSVRWLPLDPVSDFDAAQRIYRRCRGDGVTPRGLLDCLITAVAFRTGAHMLTADIDRTRVAEVIGVAVDPVSTGVASGDNSGR